MSIVVIPPSAGIGGPENGQAGIVAPTAPGAAAGTRTQAANRAYFARVVPSRNVPITAIAFTVSTVASAADPVDVGVYSANGTLLTSSGPVTAFTTGTNLLSTGVKTIALSYTLQANTVYYLALSYGALGGASAATLGGIGMGSAEAAQLFGSTIGTLEYFYKDTAHPLPASVTGPNAIATTTLLAARES